MQMRSDSTCRQAITYLESVFSDDMIHEPNLRSVYGHSTDR